MKNKLKLMTLIIFVLSIYLSCSNTSGNNSDTEKLNKNQQGSADEEIKDAKADYKDYDSKDVKTDITQDFVGAEEFFKLKDSVNKKIMESLKPADNNPRKETLQTKSVALRGTIVTPSKIIEDGVILIDYRNEHLGGKTGEKLVGKITKVMNYSGSSIPNKYKLVDLSGNFIYPGFIELHNHVHYNAFDLWKPTYDIYPNRDVWPKDPRYFDWKKMNFYFSKDYKDMQTEVTKFGEIKGLMGGATMMQGYNGEIAGSYGLTRNVENKGNLLGVDHINQTVMPVNMWWKGNEEKAESKRDKVLVTLGKKTKRYIIHFCEGIDDKIREEFERMREFDMIREEFIGIHSTALRGDDWNDIAKSGMKVVWSPLSNLMLYNKTTDIKGALEHGVPQQHISFAPDWGPSGTPNILFEAKVVAEYNAKELDNLLTPKQILSMMTEYPAIISGYDKFVGQIKEGLRADLTILKKVDDDPYKSVLKSGIEDVNLVMVDGQPLYGELEYYKIFDKGNDYEIISVNDKEKAIDITEESLEKGDQTLADLFKILNESFEDIKKTVPFEFEQDVNEYCRLAPLYWPKHTSYKNLMYVSVLGKGSDYYDKSFQQSDFYKKRNKSAKDDFKEFKGNAMGEKKTVKKKGSRKNYDNDESYSDEKPKKKSKKSSKKKNKKNY
ncbi:amidohydrolase family protein, partial [Candidatus Dependentiae bacterium]|nr:amidohydrolase family protein [Candidatus Dependentiae bacterium]